MSVRLFLIGLALAVFPFGYLAAQAQPAQLEEDPVPCLVAHATPPVMRAAVIDYVKAHDWFTLSFEEDACAGANQTVAILNKTFQGDYFKNAQGFEFFTLTDENSEFNTFLIVRFSFDSAQSAGVLEQAYKKRTPPVMAADAPLQIDVIASGSNLSVLLSPPLFFLRNRDMFRELQKGLQP